MLTQAQIKELQVAYGAIERIDTSGGTYDALCKFLDACEDDKLVTLADAKIKWVSTLANTRIIKRKMDGQWGRESRLGPHHDAIIAEARRMTAEM